MTGSSEATATALNSLSYRATDPTGHRRPSAPARFEEIADKMLFTFLLVVHAIIAALLVTVILMQKSEGGGLGMGGGPAGLMTARGAADFLTRATSVLATLFVLMAFLLATLASMRNGAGEIDTSLAHQAAPGPINAPAAPATPTSAIPLMGAVPPPAAPDALTSQALAPASAGPPTKPIAQTAPAPAPAPVLRPSLSHLETIDTHSRPATVGIDGVSTKSAASSDVTPAPAKPPTETKPATDASGSTPAGNAAQPQ